MKASSGNFWKSRRFLIAAAVVVVVAGVIIVPRLFNESHGELTGEVYPPVVLGPATIAPLTQKLTFSGHLKPADTTTLVAKIGGKILAILVKEGDKVVEGQLLGRLEDDVVRLQAEQAAAAYQAAKAQLQKVTTAVRPEELSSAKASLAQAEEDLVNAKTTLDRTKNLYDSGTLPKSKYEDAQSKVKAAETSIDNARRQVKLMEDGARSEDIQMAQAQANAQGKQLELAQLQQDYAQLKAPISGRVAVIHVERGNTIGPGMPFLTIVSDSDIFASVMIPEPYYGAFYTDPSGFEVNVTPIAWKDHPPFRGRITEVASIIDGASRSFDVEMAVDNPNHLLKPGMFAEVELVRKTKDNVTQVPEKTLLNRDGKTVLFVALPAADPAKPAVRVVKMVEVKTAAKGANMVQIVSGIETNTQIVLQGNTFLEDGQKVTVVNQDAAK
ncbi:MAG: efflux RND transporter periplasmic adaptor subunit [Spirochaetales bacterium]